MLDWAAEAPFLNPRTGRRQCDRLRSLLTVFGLDIGVMSERAPDLDPEALTPEVRDAIARLADENALLRATLAEARAQVGDLEAVSEVDLATGLPCGRALLDQLERAVSQAERHATPAALITIDLKALGEINSRHGRVAGDAALTHVGRLLRGLVRSSDLVARTGGGFALLLDHLDPDSAIETGERIARIIADQPLDLGNTEVVIEARIGVATILRGDTSRDVLRRAELNRNRVKQF